MYELGSSHFGLHAASAVCELLQAAGIDGRIARDEDAGDATDRPRAEEAAPTLLDLRGLPAPEPLQRALDAVERLREGDSLVLWTPLYPAPLLELLDARGVPHTCRRLPDGSARTTVHGLRGTAAGR